MAGKTRSPNYPALSLPQVLKLANALWQRESRTVVEPRVAVKAFGYESLSGSARVALGAMKQYGLLEKSAHGIRLSDLAVRLLHPADEADRQAATEAAALTPPLFRELSRTHAKASDEAIKSLLITQKGFAPRGVGEFVKAFRDTLKLVGTDYSGNPQTGEKAMEIPKIVSAVGSSAGYSSALAGGTSVAREVSVLEEGEAILQWPATLSAASVEELEEWLTLVLKKLKRRVNASAD
jgi:hypothetical protein